jgi:hypothetical protein
VVVEGHLPRGSADPPLPPPRRPTIFRGTLRPAYARPGPGCRRSRSRPRAR